MQDGQENACPPRRSGRKPPEAGMGGFIRGATPLTPTVVIAGWANPRGARHRWGFIPWVSLPLVSGIWRVMSRSGARIGTPIIKRDEIASIVCCVVARGTTLRAFCAPITTSGSTPMAGASSGVFVVVPRVFRRWVLEFMSCSQHATPVLRKRAWGRTAWCGN
jgi:hypothetical protein